MSLETVSTKRNRVYVRAFDHDEAQALRAQGWSVAKLARHFGVSWSSVDRVCNPARRQAAVEATARWAEKTRHVPCQGGCGRRVWMQPGRSGYCHACCALLRVADDVREGELRCSKCREWKSDEAYAPMERAARRGRRSHCRECEAAARRELRRRAA